MCVTVCLVFEAAAVSCYWCWPVNACSGFRVRVSGFRVQDLCFVVGSLATEIALFVAADSEN